MVDGIGRKKRDVPVSEDGVGIGGALGVLVELGLAPLPVQVADGGRALERRQHLLVVLLLLALVYVKRQPFHSFFLRFLGL